MSFSLRLVLKFLLRIAHLLHHLLEMGVQVVPRCNALDHEAKNGNNKATVEGYFAKKGMKSDQGSKYLR